MKKTIAAFIQILIFIAVIYFVCINIQSTSNINYFQNSPMIILTTASIIMAAYMLGLLTGVMQAIVHKGSYQSQIEFYARKNEKLAQQNEIDTDDKEALQRKIATLEIALENALKNRN